MSQESAAPCPGAEIATFYSPIDLATGAVGLALTRETMRDWLRSAGMADPHLHQLLIAVGEACSNVVEHSGAERSDEVPPAWVEAGCDHGQVRVTVTDRGRWKPSDPSPSPTGRRGRGWLMMKNLVDHARMHGDHNGTTVELVKNFVPGPVAEPPGGSRAGERLRITRGDGGEVVLAGELDQGTAHRLSIVLQAAAAEPILLVDLCAVHHLQSAGVAVLFEHARQNLRLRVLADSAVATVIEICGLNDFVPVEFRR